MVSGIENRDSVVSFYFGSNTKVYQDEGVQLSSNTCIDASKDTQNLNIDIIIFELLNILPNHNNLVSWHFTGPMQ